MLAQLMCPKCGEHFKVAPLFTGCPTCAEKGILSVLETAYSFEENPFSITRFSSIKSLWKYVNLLPCGDIEHIISLGEGDTALVKSKAIGPELGLNNLYFKNEFTNPTWSFKDRYVSVTINVARQLGFTKTVVASTGNLGVSAAAYSAAAGMKCLFIAPKEVSPAILAQAHLHGADIAITPWEERHRFLEYVAKNHGFFPISLFMPMAIHNPFGVEGYKTIGYEIIEALEGSPAAVLFPCARGNGLYGAWKGFKEAQEWGWINDLPAMVSCQPILANSLEESIRQGVTEPVELPPARSVATSTTETVSDVHALSAIRDSNGVAVSASDDQILSAMKALGREGLCVEAASALPVACLPKMIDSGLVKSEDKVVCVLTAAGIKWPDQLVEQGLTTTEVEPTEEKMDEFMTRI
jgi:threonine synthase